MGKGILTYFIKVYQRILSGINFYLKGFAVPAYKVFQNQILNDGFPKYNDNKCIRSHLVPVELFIRYVFYKIKSDNSGYTNNDTGNIENAKRIVEINSFQNSSDCYL